MALSFVLYITVVDLGETTLMSVFFFPLVYPKEHYQALIHIYGSILFLCVVVVHLGEMTSMTVFSYS